MMLTKILLVDSDSFALDLLCAVLGNAGYTTEICRTGGEAMERVKLSHYDAVITDIMAAAADSGEFIDRMQAENPDIPVLSISRRIAQGDAGNVAGLATALTGMH